MSGTSEVVVDRYSVGFQLKLHLVKVILGGNAEDSDEVWFGEECLAVVYHGETHIGSGGVILNYIDNM